MSKNPGPPREELGIAPIEDYESEAARRTPSSSSPAGTRRHPPLDLPDYDPEAEDLELAAVIAMSLESEKKSLTDEDLRKHAEAREKIYGVEKEIELLSIEIARLELRVNQALLDRVPFDNPGLKIEKDQIEKLKIQLEEAKHDHDQLLADIQRVEEFKAPEPPSPIPLADSPPTQSPEKIYEETFNMLVGAGFSEREAHQQAALASPDSPQARDSATDAARRADEIDDLRAFSASLKTIPEHKEVPTSPNTEAARQLAAFGYNTQPTTTSARDEAATKRAARKTSTTSIPSTQQTLKIEDVSDPESAESDNRSSGEYVSGGESSQDEQPSRTPSPSSARSTSPKPGVQHQ